jgi:hypothetical protein
LSAVTGGGDPSGPIDVDPDVVGSTTLEIANARVETHPDPRGNAAGPVMAGKLSLRFNGRLKGSIRSQEHCEERIALGPDLDAVPRSDGSAQDPPMVVLHPLVGLVTDPL